MDDRLQLRLETLSGKVCTVTPKCSDTMRSIITDSFGTAEGSPSCFVNGRPISLDLSLAIQNVKPFDTVRILFRQPKRVEKRESCTDSVERHEQELFEEALRVSDVSFLLIEASNMSNLFYSAFTDESDEESEIEQTVVENSQNISEEPLPPCWLVPESDNFGQLVVKSCCPTKEPFVARECERAAAGYRE